MNILALYFASVAALAAEPKVPGHCYSSNSDFAPRIIKILELKNDEYKYMLFSQNDWYGPLKNFKETIEVNYTKEVNCPK